MRETTMVHHIAIIGAGPRGTYCLRRLTLHLKRHPLQLPVHIHIVEKSGRFGGGGVHSVAQPEYLLLNTIGSQITAFGDDDEEARQSEARKTLWGYLVDKGVTIGPNDYPSRAQHGRYLAEMMDWTETVCPSGVSVHRHAAEAVDIEDSSAGSHKIVFSDGSGIPADEILLLTGHAKNRIVPGSPAAEWAAYADKQRRRGSQISYIHLVYPIEEKTRHIQPQDPIYVIGMGLTAVDIVKTLTIGRGGVFSQGTYVPSGKEPHIILGSRLGLPYSARAHNQKEGQYKGRLLTLERALALKSRQAKTDFVADLLPLIRHEMAFVYYATLLGQAWGERFLDCRSADERRQLVEADVAPESRFSWDDLADPLRRIKAESPKGQPWFASLEAYVRFVTDHIRRDIEEAEKGNLTSPIKTAIDSVLRDLRDVLRLLVDRGGLTAASHRYLDGAFNRTNNRIAVGPPVSSVKDLLTLAQMGIVSFSGPSPELSIAEDEGAFLIESKQVPGSARVVRHVLNGRIHGVDNKNDGSRLIRNLLQKGWIRTFVNRDGTGAYELGGLDISDDFNIIGDAGKPHPHICALGIPVEGKFWFNAVDARPDVGSNAIAQLGRWAELAVGRLGSREAQQS